MVDGGGGGALPENCDARGANPSYGLLALKDPGETMKRPAWRNRRRGTPGAGGQGSGTGCTGIRGIGICGISIRGIAVLGVAGLVMAGGAAVQPLAAHHAVAMYDRQRTITVIGTVVEFQWTNPHVFVLVKGTIDMDDEAAIWRLETTSPSTLLRLGWSATALRFGDRVSIVANPHRRGDEKSALLLRVTLLDTGQELGTAYVDIDQRAQ
jgi:hypothetical protein